MPSGLSDSVVDGVLDKLLGSGADTSLLGATIYLDFLTDAPSDDNGTGAVSWGQGRVAITVTNGTSWPAASGRSKTSVPFVTPTNSSGSDIDIVAVGFYTASSGGTYLGGGPVPGGLETIPAGASATVYVTLSAPSPGS